MAKVEFTYCTGLTRSVFKDAYLTGSWDLNGRYSNQWSNISMQQTTGEDGCPCFTATVNFDDTQIGRTFSVGCLYRYTNRNKSVGNYY